MKAYDKYILYTRLDIFLLKLYTKNKIKVVIGTNLKYFSS